MGEEERREKRVEIMEAIRGLEDEEILALWGLLTDHHVAPMIHRENVERGWWKDLQEAGPMEPKTAAAFKVATLYTKAALIASEVFEGGEALRHGLPPDDHLPEFGNLEVELADAVVRVLDLSSYLVRDESAKVGVGGALVAKVRYNRTRGEKHGGKAV